MKNESFRFSKSMFADLVKTASKSTHLQPHLRLSILGALAQPEFTKPNGARYMPANKEKKADLAKVSTISQVFSNAYRGLPAWLKPAAYITIAAAITGLVAYRFGFFSPQEQRQPEHPGPLHPLHERKLPQDLLRFILRLNGKNSFWFASNESLSEPLRIDGFKNPIKGLKIEGFEHFVIDEAQIENPSFQGKLLSEQAEPFAVMSNQEAPSSLLRFIIWLNEKNPFRLASNKFTATDACKRFVAEGGGNVSIQNRLPPKLPGKQRSFEARLLRFAERAEARLNRTHSATQNQLESKPSDSPTKASFSTGLYHRVHNFVQQNWQLMAAMLATIAVRGIPQGRVLPGGLRPGVGGELLPREHPFDLFPGDNGLGRSNPNLNLIPDRSLQLFKPRPLEAAVSPLVRSPKKSFVIQSGPRSVFIWAGAERIELEMSYPIVINADTMHRLVQNLQQASPGFRPTLPWVKRLIKEFMQRANALPPEEHQAAIENAGEIWAHLPAYSPAEIQILQEVQSDSRLRLAGLQEDLDRLDRDPSLPWNEPPLEEPLWRQVYRRLYGLENPPEFERLPAKRMYAIWDEMDNELKKIAIEKKKAEENAPPWRDRPVITKPLRKQIYRSSATRAIVSAVRRVFGPGSIDNWTRHFIGRVRRFAGRPDYEWINFNRENWRTVKERRRGELSDGMGRIKRVMDLISLLLRQERRAVSIPMREVVADLNAAMQGDRQNREMHIEPGAAAELRELVIAKQQAQRRLGEENGEMNIEPEVPAESEAQRGFEEEHLVRFKNHAKKINQRDDMWGDVPDIIEELEGEEEKD